MSRLRWPDSTNSVSEKPGTIHTDRFEKRPSVVEGDVPCAVETQRQLGSRLRNHL